MQKNYWIENDDLLISNINNSLTRYNNRCLSSSPLISSLSSSSSQIPRIIHFIWLGSKSLPQHCEKLIESWSIVHSNWLIKVWTDDSIKDLYIENRDKFENADNYGMKSDILRYEILYREGGVYIDIDYECLQSLETIVCNSSFFAGLSSTLTLEINNGIIGSIPYHPLLEILINSIKTQPVDISKPTTTAFKNQISSFLSNDEISVFDSILTSATNNDKYMKTIRETGPGLFTKTIFDIFFDSVVSNEIVIFPKNIFSPVPNTYRVNLSNDEEVSNLKSRYVDIDTIAIHWSQRSWQI